MKTRLIEKHASDLPPNFAVIDSRSYRAAIADALAAFADPKIELVVWNAAAALMPELKQPFVSPTAEIVNTYTHTRPRHGVEARHNRLFTEFNRQAHLPEDFLKAWKSASTDLARALYEGTPHHKDSKFTSGLRQQHPSPKDNPHWDWDVVDDNKMVTLRILNGDKTPYFSADDVLEQPKPYSLKTEEERKRSVLIKPDASRWFAGNLAVVFHSIRVAHALPSVETGSPENQWRQLEIHYTDGRFIACQNP